MRLAEFLDKLSDVTEEGDGYIAACPAHVDSHPSLKIDLGTDRRLLLVCRAGCTGADVLTALGITRSTVDRATGEVTESPDWGSLFDVDPGDRPVRPVSKPTAAGLGAVAALAQYVDAASERLREAGADSQAGQYIRRRFGLDIETAVSLGVGLDTGEDMPPMPYLSAAYRRVPRLTVPLCDAWGDPRGLQGRDITGTDPVRWCGLSNPSGEAWARCGLLDPGTGLDVVLVTEGPGDGLTAAGAGFAAVVVRGAMLTNEDTVAAVLEMANGRRIVTAGDGDEAGLRFAGKLAEALAAHGVPVFALAIPEDLADADLTGWRERDPAAFCVLLSAAVRNAPRVSVADSSEPDPAPEPESPPEAERAALTDLGNAERLHVYFGGLVRHSAEMGFFLWDGTAWVPDRHDAVRTAAHAVTRALAADARHLMDSRDASEQERGTRLYAWAMQSQSRRAIDSMVRELAAISGVAVDIEQMDARHDLVACRNGVVNLRTGEITPHDPQLLITRRLDVEYDPGAKCPRWEAFLTEVFPRSPDMPEYMRRLVGYGITGETSEQCFAVLWGTGSNGKSVFTDTLTSVFRSLTVTTPFSTFERRASGGIPNDLAALKGARLVMASEGEQGVPMAEAVMKRVTGRDVISARFMRREFFEFRPTFLIFLASNYKPSFRGQDEGLWRRVKLIPWDRYFAPHERDHYLLATLAAESRGILAWAVRGAMEWYANGLQDPPAVVDATREYRDTSDALSGFFPGTLVRDPEAAMLGAEAYTEYTKWTEEEGLPLKERWSRKTFYGAMDERGVPKVKRARGITLLGIRRADARGAVIGKPRGEAAIDEVLGEAG